MSGSTGSSSTTVQVSKIQLRRGLQGELPGWIEPNATPPRFTAPLDPGEMGFVVDAGRLYIGPDLRVGYPQSSRTIYPYQNIEVLTENSTDVIEGITNVAITDMQGTFITAAPLTSGSGVLSLPNTTGGVTPAPFLINIAATGVGARLSYVLLASGSAAALRTGMMTLSWDGTNAPVLADDGVVPALPSAPYPADPASALGVSFTATAVANGVSGTDVEIAYTNTTGSAVTMLFRIERANPAA